MSIEATIEKYIVEEIMLADRNTKIDPDESLIDSGILDSLALLRFINFLEDQFDIMVDDIEVVPDNFQSINTAAAFVSTKLANGS
jgi:acyl carrier protein